MAFTFFLAKGLFNDFWPRPLVAVSNTKCKIFSSEKIAFFVTVTFGRKLTFSVKI